MEIATVGRCDICETTRSIVWDEQLALDVHASIDLFVALRYPCFETAARRVFVWAWPVAALQKRPLNQSRLLHVNRGSLGSLLKVRIELD